MLTEKLPPTHILRIEVPLNLKDNLAVEEWDIQGAFAAAMSAVLPMTRLGTLGLICNDIIVSVDEVGNE